MDPQRLGFFMGVQCIVTNQSGCILLGRRIGPTGAGQWALPSGHVEYGETPAQTGQRELNEEVGIWGAAARFGQAFFTWSTNTPYAHIPVIFDSFSGTPRAVEGEAFTEAAFFPLGDLPRPLFEPTEIAIDKVFGNSAAQALRVRDDTYIQIDMLNSNTKRRRNAAWRAQAFLAKERNALVLSWGPRRLGTAQVDIRDYDSRDRAVDELRRLVARRLAHEYVLFNVAGDWSISQLQVLFPKERLQVVSQSFLARLAGDASARAAYRRDSPVTWQKLENQESLGVGGSFPLFPDDSTSDPDPDHQPDLFE